MQTAAAITSGHNTEGLNLPELCSIDFIANSMKSPLVPETWILGKIREKNLWLSYPTILAHLHSILVFLSSTGYEILSPFPSPLIFSTGSSLNIQVRKAHFTTTADNGLLRSTVLLLKLGQIHPSLSESSARLPRNNTMLLLWS